MNDPLTQQLQEEASEKSVPCDYCGGDGFTAEHDPLDRSEDHLRNGYCTTCPIQVPCEHCHAEGKYLTLDIVKTLIATAIQKAREEELGKIARLHEEVLQALTGTITTTTTPEHE